MSDVIFGGQVAHLVEPREIIAFNVLGPVVEYLTPPVDDEPCVMRGTIPPGISVPLHSHADPETFYLVSGKLEGLVVSPTGSDWVEMRPDDIFHVPGGAKHAFRNQTATPAVMIIISTDKIGRFLQEVGISLIPGTYPSGPPTDEAIQHFLETAKRDGYWNAPPR